MEAGLKMARPLVPICLPSRCASLLWRYTRRTSNKSTLLDGMAIFRCPGRAARADLRVDNGDLVTSKATVTKTG
jgi:hypothetical protein